MTGNSFLVLNGPGLADLSAGEGRYGDITLERIRDKCSALCEQLGVGLDFRQTDDDEEMSRWIAKDSANFAALIINPVGYVGAGTVDSEMYRSAITMIVDLKKPIVEVHITNIFRDRSELARPLQRPEGEMGFICGLGIHGYLLAIRAVQQRLQS